MNLMTFYKWVRKLHTTMLSKTHIFVTKKGATLIDLMTNRNCLRTHTTPLMVVVTWLLSKPFGTASEELPCFSLLLSWSPVSFAIKKNPNRKFQGKRCSIKMALFTTWCLRDMYREWLKCWKRLTKTNLFWTCKVQIKMSRPLGSLLIDTWIFTKTIPSITSSQ